MENKILEQIKAHPFVVGITLSVIVFTVVSRTFLTIDSRTHDLYERQIADYKSKADRVEEMAVKLNEAQRQTRDHAAEIARLESDHRREVDQLGERLRSIHRRLGDSEYLDVRKLVIRKSERDQIPAASAYFHEEHFFASTNLGNWKMTTMSTAELFQEITGEEPPADMRRGIALSPIYVWRPDQTLSVKGSSILSNVFPFVAVQRLPITELSDAMNWGTTQISMKIENGVTNVVGTKYSNLEKGFPGDTVGVFLASALNSLFLSTSFFSDEMKGEIITIQKVENVLYAQCRFTFYNANINNTKYREFYCYIDGMVVGAPPNLYFVTTVVPTSEPTSRGEDFHLVADWFQDFAVLLDP